ncbi:hypothetical protein E9529_13190 [Blastococcus sp. KM273128]|nr:hypothetical protein [Blastococcus sp. KM273128]
MSASGAHVFVDESKRRGYLLAAVAVPVGDLHAVRKVLRDLVLPGQRRLHMKDESDPRRRAIASAIVGCGVRAIVYDAARRHRTDRDRREACLRLLVDDAAARGDHALVLEQDDTLVASDRRILYHAARYAGCAETLRYDHRRAGAELLLALPDAVAWCWARGGDWRRRIGPAINGVRQV